MNRFHCCGDERRALVADHPSLNGIDFLEVDTADRRILYLRFLRPIGGAQIAARDLRIDGGIRVQGVEIVDVARLGAVGEAALVLVVRVDRVGDFSRYRLRLDVASTPAWLDPRFAAVDFSFRIDCETDFDCDPVGPCPPEPPDEPAIDYLARDYESFTRLMLDRMMLTAPAWTERNPADLGVALVELLAYLGDHLSYRQDMATTEAHLSTARRRISVRRHVRLVDYFMHEGANARVWVRVLLDPTRVGPFEPVGLPAHTRLLTRVPLPDLPRRLEPDSTSLARAEATNPTVFETMTDVVLRAAHDTFFIYSWGDRGCCLPVGATQVTLAGHHPHLKVGDVLLFEEVLGPRSGVKADADPRHRQAVRLTRVPRDPVDCRFVEAVDPLDGTPITTVQWGAADALRFPVCVSAFTDTRHYVENVSVVHGNLVLADHGETRPMGALEVPPPDEALTPVAPRDDTCEPPVRVSAPPRFRPVLPEAGLTWIGTVDRTALEEGVRRRLPFDPHAAASAAYVWSLEHARPAIELRDDNGRRWLPRRDLIASSAAARDFTVEMDEEGRAHLRFGDGVNALRPAPGTRFSVTCRIGSGPAGNLGAEALHHVVTDEAAVAGVLNPLPARGGTAAETTAHARRMAPHAFQVQERAVTPADWVRLVERHPTVARAAATLRWTGSWYTVVLIVDLVGNQVLDAALRRSIRAHMERYRLAGYDVEVRPPRFVPLAIHMHVCVSADYHRAHVGAALRDVFQAGRRADGSPGVFHADQLSFGEPIFLSELYAHAHAVPGVESVRVDGLRRHGAPEDDASAIAAGELPIGPFEVARLDNDPNFPERGEFHLTLDGGR